LQDRAKVHQFELAFLPHLDAAYTLARWIMSNPEDAEDVVQEAYLRAFKYFTGFQGENSRSWMLKIVRNTCYTWIRKNRPNELLLELDDDIKDTDDAAFNPESFLQTHQDHQLVHRALAGLPVEYRELIILREVEGLSYKEIAVISGNPIGTVMSRLGRARMRLKNCLASCLQEGSK
jgi:RNA polymerase sigma-70 factor (ECF subfamily)